MRALFGAKGIILIWAFLTATTGLSLELKRISVEIRGAHAEKTVEGIFNVINSLVPKAVDFFFETIKFQPNNPIFSSGLVTIRTIDFLTAASLLVLVIVIVIYDRAIKSKGFADDLLMLPAFYLVVQIGFGIWTQAIGIIRQIQLGALFVIMALLIAFLTLRGGGMNDSKLFWRGVFEIYLACFFFFPVQTIGFSASTLEFLAGFGEILRSSTAFVVWCILGIFLAAWLIYGVGNKPQKSTGEVLDGLKKKIDEEFEKAI